MALAVPPGIPSIASWRVWYVVTLSNPLSVSIATDIGAASTVDASNIFVAGGLAFDVAVEKWKDERLATPQVFEQLGAQTYSIGDITYVFDPQTPASATNKLYAAVGDGGSGWLVVRFGMPADTTPAAAQKVWTVPTAFSPAVPLPPEANAMTRAKQSVTVTNLVNRTAVLAA